MEMCGLHVSLIRMTTEAYNQCIPSTPQICINPMASYRLLRRYGTFLFLGDFESAVRLSGVLGDGCWTQKETTLM